MLEKPVQGMKQVATFFVSGVFFGVPVEMVQEVLLSQQMAPVPLAGDTIGGLINLRGQIVTAVDVRRVLKLPEPEAPVESMNVVLRGIEGGSVSLLVDDIGEVLDLSPSAFEAPPANVPELFQRLTDGIYKVSDRLLILLKANELVQSDGEAEKERVQ